MTIAETLAETATRLTYEDLPDDVKSFAKLVILDTLGCGIAGIGGSRARPLLKNMIDDIGGHPESTLFGTQERTSCLNATLYNTLLVRSLGLNDTYDSNEVIHPSINIPALLAIGEKEHSTTQDLLTAIILAYELSCRFCEIATPTLTEQGWFTNCFYSFSVALGASKLFRLDSSATANAICIAGSRGYTLFEILTSPTISMMSNMADPLTAHNAIMSALLARNGMTGPRTILEGKNGFCRVLTDSCKLDRLIDDFGTNFLMTECAIKPYPGSHWVLPAVTATLGIVKENNIRAADVEKVEVHTFEKAVVNSAQPEKYSPKTRESADHSLPYCVAVGILDGVVGPAQFTEDKINSTAIIELLKKIHVSSDPEIEKESTKNRGPAIVSIRTKDGKEHSMRVDFEKGHHRNPMSEKEVEEKFRVLTNGFLPESQSNRVIDAVSRFEDMRSISDLMTLLNTQRG